MPFVKLDCGMVDSSIWVDRDQRSIFITALLMAVPVELTHAAPQLQVRSLEATGWVLPPGRYGFVEAAGTGIIRRDGMADLEAGLRILEELGAPDSDSRSQDFDGRRLIRVDGGYVVLNYFLYRDRDYTAADRQRRHRERKKGVAGSVTRVTRNDVTRDVTQADADAEVELTPAVVEEPPEPSRVTDGGDLAQSLTIALNRGMKDNPAIGDLYNPIVSTSGHSFQAAEALRAAGVDPSFAYATVYGLAKHYKPRKVGDQIGSLAYLQPAIIDAWERERARIAAAGAPLPPESQSNGDAATRNPPPKTSGNGTYTLRAGEIINLIRSYKPPEAPERPPDDPADFREGPNGRMERIRPRPEWTPPPPAWRANLSEPETRAVEAIGVARILSATESTSGIVLAQLSKAIGEASR